MTNETIIQIIKDLNKKKINDLLFIRPLSDSVDFAKLWSQKPLPSSDIIANEQSMVFYFIKNPENNYVGAVYDMQFDLHWYVMPKFRGKGYLTTNLKNIILPHIFQNRKKQIVTIEKNAIDEKYFNASEKVALNVGFKKRINEEEKSVYELSASKYKGLNKIEGLNTKISEDRMMQLKKEINFLANSLRIIQTEIEMKLGAHEYTSKLKKLIREIQDHTWRLEDLWWKCK